MNKMASGLNWRSWRLPSVKYSALVTGQSKNSRSSSVGHEENRPLNKENADVDDEEDDLESPVHMNPPKKAYWGLRPLVALLCLAFLACGALLGYVAGGLHVLRSPGDNGTTNSAISETAFGTEYNKFIYKENEFGERYCPDEDLTLRREWRKMSRVEKRQFIQGVKCLKHKPSKTRPTGTLFEDFAFVRGQIGMRSKSPGCVSGQKMGTKC
jgi:hypothetical protein